MEKGGKKANIKGKDPEKKQQKVEKEKESQKEKKKKKPSGYLLFSKDLRPKVVKDNPDMKAKDILTELGRLWRESSDDVKEKYNQLSKDWKGDDDSEVEKPKAKKPSKPKEKDKEKDNKKKGKKKGDESDDD